MTGTDYMYFTQKSVPIIFEPPCTCVPEDQTLQLNLTLIIELLMCQFLKQFIDR